MTKKIPVLILILIIILNLTACGSEPPKRYEAEFLKLFDTVSKIIAYTESKEEFADLIDNIYSELETYHELYDIYNNYEGINNIKTINDNAGKKPVKVDRKIIDLLLFSKEIHEISGGKTNIALGSVLRIWHDYRERGLDFPEKAELPPIEDLKEADKHTDINDLIIDEKNSTVFLKDPKMSLDVGSVAKGYAVERISETASKDGLSSFLMSIGGNVRAKGLRGDGSLWNIGIQKPGGESGDNVGTLELTDMSVVTSGIYERYYTVDGKDYHHLINPDTLMPADYFSSLTIVCEDSGMADALSTAVFTLPYDQGLEFVESLEDTEALWIFHDGSIKSSSGFDALLKDES